MNTLIIRRLYIEGFQDYKFNNKMTKYFVRPPVLQVLGMFYPQFDKYH